MKKSEKFRIIEWSVDCPYCKHPVDRTEAIEEQETVVCNSCKKRFISGGFAHA